MLQQPALPAAHRHPAGAMCWAASTARATPLGYLGAFFSNTHRRPLGAWLERVVFSTPVRPLPFATHDHRTAPSQPEHRQRPKRLAGQLLHPLVLQAVHIPSAARRLLGRRASPITTCT